MKTKDQRYIIYVITNRINDKQYVGVTRTSLNTRWITHKSAAKTKQDYFKFPNALRKYGTGDDVWNRIELCSAINLKDASFLEKLLIAELKTYDEGYNSSKGGELYEGYQKRNKWSDDRKERMSKLHKARGTRPPVSLGKSNARFGKPGTMLGKTHTAETKNKMSRNHHRRVPVMIEGVQYKSITEAYEKTNWSKEKIKKYIKSL